jgi:hypothetical protein
VDEEILALPEEQGGRRKAKDERRKAKNEAGIG